MGAFWLVEETQAGWPAPRCFDNLEPLLLPGRNAVAGLFMMDYRNSTLGFPLGYGEVSSSSVEGSVGLRPQAAVGRAQYARRLVSSLRVTAARAPAGTIAAPRADEPSLSV